MRKLLLLLSFVSLPAFSWVSGENVTIENIVLWQEAETSSPMYFKTSNDLWCYIPAGEKVLQSTVLELYTSKNEVSVHCHDMAERLDDGISPAHKLHRIWAY